jgi:hypothetical protein
MDSIVHECTGQYNATTTRASLSGGVRSVRELPCVFDTGSDVMTAGESAFVDSPARYTITVMHLGKTDVGHCQDRFDPCSVVAGCRRIAAKELD